MSLEYRVMSWGDEVVSERTAIWEDAARITEKALRAIDIVGTDERVDRHNTKILVDGWQLDDYRTNPVFLWSHNMDPAVSTMPIGRIIGIYRETYARAGDPAKIGKRLSFRVEFPEKGKYDFADLVYNMYEGKFLRASSVGFRNIKSRRLDPTDEEDKKIIEQDGFDVKHPYGSAILEKNALMELSAVPVGSNPNALAKALRDATPEAHRALVSFTAETAIDDAWVAERFELLREALAPAEEAVTADEIPAAPTAAQLALLRQVVDETKRTAELKAIRDIIEHAIAAAMEANTESIKDVKKQLEALRSEVSHITDRIADLGGAERMTGEEPIVSAPADPWEALFGENEEQLRRISSLLK